MRTFLQSSDQSERGDALPLWQRERERLLQKACESVSRRIQNGTGFMRAVRDVATYFNGRQFRSDPSRALKLSRKTLIAIFYAWREGGRKPDVFRLKYICRRPLFTDLAILRFADFLLRNPGWSLEKSWRVFSKRGGNLGRRRHMRKRAVAAALKKGDQICRLADNYFRRSIATAQAGDFQI